MVAGWSTRAHSQHAHAAHHVPFTHERYTAIKRGPFKELGDEDIAYFRSVLDPAGVVTDELMLQTANTDWMRKYRGNSRLMLRPKTVAEVSLVLQYCNEKRLAVVPQGGNTSLVGGSVPVFDEVILNMSRRNNILHVDEVAGFVICGAGCVLDNLNTHLAQYGFTMPLDLGSKGSCQIGGNVSTNAGGVRVLRYGSLHGSVIGIKAVLADGTVVDTISPCRKDNTGYDIKQLFIGSEGTLGVVTTVALLVPTAPKAVNVAFLGMREYADVCRVLQEAKGTLAEILSAYEFMDSGSMDVVVKNLKMRNPLATECPFYVLLETAGSNCGHDMEKLNSLLESIMEKGLCVDGTVAQDLSQASHMWAVRDNITEALTHDGEVYKYDVSLPVGLMYSLVTIMRDRVPQAVRVVGYGHVGDGNLHLNITSAEYDREIVKLVEPFVYHYVANHSGSVSAEHGLGFMKSNCISFSKPPAAIEVMRRMKDSLDPHGILNPYKTIPPL